MTEHLDDHNEPSKRGLFARIRANFLTGLVFVMPIALTVYFAWWVVNFVDSKVDPFLPERFNPNHIWNIDERFGFEIPGIGVIFFLVVVTFVGSLTKGLLGRTLLRWISNLINKFPILRTIYAAVQQIVETVFANKDKNFEYACLVEYPRKGLYVVGFVSKQATGEIAARHAGKELMAIFVPTTPNPTSGFLLYVPKKDVQILDMPVEDAAKLTVSAGLVEPEYPVVKKG